MPVSRAHYIHSRNGRIGGSGTDHAPADVDAVIQSLKESEKDRLAIHFHGGLVPKAAALDIAANLLPVYGPAAYPLFFVWESGPWETVKNNLADIAKEPVFQGLVRKLLEYSLGKLGARSDARTIGPGAVDSEEVKANVRAFFDDPLHAPVPYADVRSVDSRSTRAAPPGVDEEEIEADLSSDIDFVRALRSIADAPSGSRAAALPVAVAPHPTQMDGMVLAQIAPSPSPGARGLISLTSVAIFTAKALARILRRHWNGRDHGLYATVVEEVLRGFYAEAVGKTFLWNQMKKDTEDAFGGDEMVHVGTALLARLKKAQEDGLALSRIFLIGHSTGGIYISHFLAAVDAMGLDPAVRFDLVLLAPANTQKLFAETLANHSDRIRSVRMFAMKDEVERNDGLLGDDWRRALYPSSLLYFVSGLLEDEPDMPLLGMQRFYLGSPFKAPDYAECDSLREWFHVGGDRVVWSISDDGDGRRSKSRKHGDFDNDPATLQALGWIVAN